MSMRPTQTDLEEAEHEILGVTVRVQRQRTLLRDLKRNGKDTSDAKLRLEALQLLLLASKISRDAIELSIELATTNGPAPTVDGSTDP